MDHKKQQTKSCRKDNIKLLSTDNICKGSILRNITFNFSEDILCVISSRQKDIRCLFSLLCRAKEPDSGKLTLPDKKIPYLPGIDAIPKMLRVSDYLKFAADAASVKKDEYPEITKSLTGEALHLRFASLTAFNALKAALGVLLAGSPEYILLEEPTKTLPPSEYGAFIQLIKEVSQHTKVVYSCSSPSVFEELSDRLLVLSDGKQLEYGSTEEIIQKANTPGTIVCRIKGEKEKICKEINISDGKIEDTERKNVYKITVPETKDRTREIKRAVSKSGMALLDIRSDNGALKKLLEDLSDRENELTAEYEEAAEEPYTAETVDESILSFNHPDDEDESDDDINDSDPNEDISETHSTGIDIAALLAHDNGDSSAGSDDDEDSAETESTLFSSDSSAADKK